MPEKKLNEVEAGAVQTLRDLVANLDRLEADFKEDAKRQQRFRRGSIIVGAIVALCVATILYTAIQMNGLVSYIASCNTPQGECAQNRNRTTGEAIAQINENVFDASIYLGECARQYPDLRGDAYSKALRACVDAKRKAEAKRPR